MLKQGSCSAVHSCSLIKHLVSILWWAATAVSWAWICKLSKDTKIWQQLRFWTKRNSREMKKRSTNKWPHGKYPFGALQSPTYSLFYSRPSRFCHYTSLHTVWTAHCLKSSKTSPCISVLFEENSNKLLIALEGICRSLRRSWTKPKSKVIHHNT